MICRSHCIVVSVFFFLVVLVVTVAPTLTVITAVTSCLHLNADLHLHLCPHRCLHFDLCAHFILFILFNPFSPFNPFIPFISFIPFTHSTLSTHSTHSTLSTLSTLSTPHVHFLGGILLFSQCHKFCFQLLYVFFHFRRAFFNLPDLPVLNLFGSIAKPQRRQGFHFVPTRWTARQHQRRSGIATQTVLQQTCQFTVPVGDMTVLPSSLLSQGIDDVAQCRQ